MDRSAAAGFSLAVAGVAVGTVLFTTYLVLGSFGALAHVAKARPLVAYFVEQLGAFDGLFVRSSSGLLGMIASTAEYLDTRSEGPYEFKRRWWYLPSTGFASASAFPNRYIISYL
jgi:hypothetical protein